MPDPGTRPEEDSYDKLLSTEGRTIEGATRLLLDEIAIQWSRIRSPKSRKKRAADRYLRHRFGSLML